MKQRKTTILTFCGICIALNMVLGYLGAALKLPFYLDTIGTFFTAAMFGPFYGAAVGGLTNIISALILGPQDIPFALVSVAVGLIVGFVAKKKSKLQSENSNPLRYCLRCGSSVNRNPDWYSGVRRIDWHSR